MENPIEQQLEQLKSNQSIISLFGIINMLFIVSDIYNLRLSASFFIGVVCVYFLLKVSIKNDHKIKELESKL